MLTSFGEAVHGSSNRICNIVISAGLVRYSFCRRAKEIMLVASRSGIVVVGRAIAVTAGSGRTIRILVLVVGSIVVVALVRPIGVGVGRAVVPLVVVALVRVGRAVVAVAGVGRTISFLVLIGRLVVPLVVVALVRPIGIVIVGRAVVAVAGRTIRILVLIGRAVAVVPPVVVRPIGVVVGRAVVAVAGVGRTINPGYYWKSCSSPGCCCPC